MIKSIFPLGAVGGILFAFTTAALAQITIGPEPGGLLGGTPGHTAVFRKASTGFGQINNVGDAERLFGYRLPNTNVLFEAIDSGILFINYADTNTNPRPQQAFGNDRDLRKIPNGQFGLGDQDDYAAILGGFIYVPQTGTWNFGVNSDEGFRLRLGAAGDIVMESPNQRLPANSAVAINIVTPGFYQYELVYFEHAGGSEIEFFANGPGQPDDKLVGDPSNTLQVFRTLRAIDDGTLGIQLITLSNALVAWTNAGFVLEEAANLLPNAPWRLSPQSPALISSMYTVSLGTSGDTRFFRLRNLPPDPASLAPPLKQTELTSLQEATELLYMGPNPIQTGVTNATIEIRRACLLRGVVKQRANYPLHAVTISILNHPEYGQTFTRTNGMFDLVVNGGETLTVKYERTGHLPAQRHVTAPWEATVTVPDVLMIPADPMATLTLFSSNAPMQVARGSVQTDSDGSRQATLIVPAGTSANLVRPDGTIEPCGSLTLRATEYTVGANGPTSMPAPLPPNSAYTYAVELSADEALAKLGGKDVLFNQPVVFYVENFLNFPTGIPVPTGYYDNSAGRWVASESGRIIKILRITNGSAELDVNGDDSADAGLALSSLGITDAERAQLASLYAANQSLWRVRLDHLSTWDCNWGLYPPADGISPDTDDPKCDDDPPKSCKDGSIKGEVGSIIGVEDQSLGESLDVVGTPFRLYYNSRRANGRRAAHTLTIPLSRQRLPTSMVRIDLSVSIAGQQFTQSYPAAPSQTTTFLWDGTDAYGRRMLGQQPVSVHISYVYPARYQQVERFGYNGNGLLIGGSRASMEITMSKVWNGYLGGWDARSLALGGWSLDVHHVYDPMRRELHLGNGGTRRATSLLNVLSNFAGNGDRGRFFYGDGGPATSAGLSPGGLAVAPNGTVYIGDTEHNRIRAVNSEGTIKTVAGGGQGGDGSQATNAFIGDARHIALGRDGSLYVTDTNGQKIRRVSPEGIITTIAGTGKLGFTGDGGPATQAKLYYPTGIAVAPDDSVYFGNYGQVRRIGPDGIITLVAGNGSIEFSDDTPRPGREASISVTPGIALAPDGSLYIADPGNYRVRRLRPDGFLETVAGSGEPRFIYPPDGDGGLATAAHLAHPVSLAVGSDGTLFIADDRDKVRCVAPNGIITTLAGTGTSGYNGDLKPATQSKLNVPLGVASGPDGSVYIADAFNGRVRRVAPIFPGTSTGNLVIPAEDGSEVYIFNRNGRHLQTVDAFTSAVRYRFDYDAAGRLSSITDGEGQVTTIERDPSGKATAIISPYAHRTALTMDGDGYLAAVANPLGETYAFTYSDGLLQKMVDPRNATTTFQYDPLGLLTRDSDAAGGFKALLRTNTSSGHSVTMSTALKRVTTSSVESLPAGGRRLVKTFPSGLQNQGIESPDGTRTIRLPNGMVTTIFEDPDPRWGMLAPVSKTITVSTPGGLVNSIVTDRSVTLTNSANPFSLSSQIDTMAINGRTYTNSYVRSTLGNSTNTVISPMGRSAKVVLDRLNKPLRQEIAGLSPVAYAYDNRGRLTNALQGAGSEVRTTAFTYNPAGYLETITDPLGRIVRFEYDAAGRVITTLQPDGRVIKLSYDFNGNVASLTPPGRPAHTFSYSSLNLQTNYSPPAVFPGVNHTEYRYSLDRELTQIIRPDGETVSFDYTGGGGCNCGRLSSIAFARGTLAYDYDFISGNLKSITAPGGITNSYTYDGSLLISESWAGPITGSVSRTYDNNFRVTSHSVNGANAIAYQYDNDGLLIRAGDLRLNRDPQNGLLTNTVLGGVSSTWKYNGFGEPTNYTVTFNGTPLFTVDYLRDRLGRITEKTETTSGVAQVFGYGYDLAGRLTNVTQNGVTTASYTYDANGNRLSFTSSGGNITGTYDNQDRLTDYGGAVYQYTANGELRSKTLGGETTTYKYDALGTLNSVQLPDGSNLEYVVDGQGRRIDRKANGALMQRFLYQDQLKPIAELDTSGGVISRFIYGTHVNVPDYLIKGGTTFRIITDPLGSPRLVVDIATGGIVQTMDYDSFGKVLADTNPGFQPFGFAGGLYDHDTKLVRFGARDYDAETGRWTVKDPILFAGEDTVLYDYVQNDPLNRTDQLGLWEVNLEAFGGIGGGITVGGLDDRLWIRWRVGFGAGASIGFDPFKGPPDQAKGWATGVSVCAKGGRQWGPFSAVGTLRTGFTRDWSTGERHDYWTPSYPAPFSVSPKYVGTPWLYNVSAEGYVAGPQ